MNDQTQYPLKTTVCLKKSLRALLTLKKYRLGSRKSSFYYEYAWNIVIHLLSQ